MQRLNNAWEDTEIPSSLLESQLPFIKNKTSNIASDARRGPTNKAVTNALSESAILHPRRKRKLHQSFIAKGFALDDNGNLASAKGAEDAEDINNNQ